MREEQAALNGPPEADPVVQGWHPHQLRDKPPEAAPDPVIAQRVDDRFQAMLGAALTHTPEE